MQSVGHQKGVLFLESSYYILKFLHFVIKCFIIRGFALYFYLYLFIIIGLIYLSLEWGKKNLMSINLIKKNLLLPCLTHTHLCQLVAALLTELQNINMKKTERKCFLVCSEQSIANCRNSVIDYFASL